MLTHAIRCIAVRDDEILDRLANLSGGTRRMLDYLAVLHGTARYAVLRHIARVSEEDMVEDIKEAVESGLVTPRQNDANVYEFVESRTQEIIMDSVGPMRLPKLRARAEAAQKRVDER
jgi:hypothetical protein